MNRIMQTTNPKLSKCLKNLGIPQNSYFTIILDGNKCYFVDKKEYDLMLGKAKLINPNLNELKNAYSTFTLCEIMEILPKSLTSNKMLYILSLFSIAGEYKISYRGTRRGREIILMEFADKNPAEMAGYMLEWCVKKAYVVFDA